MTSEPPSYRPQPPVPPHGFHQSPPGYGPLPPPPAGRIRPGRAWIVLTWVLCVVVTVSALTWGVLGFRSGLSTVVPTQTFASGEVATVDLDPAEAQAIYVGLDAPGSVGFEVSSGFSSPVDAHCVIAGDSRDMALLQPQQTVSVTADGVEWHQILLIRVPRPGTYEVRCEGEGVRFGVANDLPEGLFGRVMGSAVVTFVAVAVAIATTIVLLLKRAAARRLHRPQAWPPPPFP